MHLVLIYNFQIPVTIKEKGDSCWANCWKYIILAKSLIPSINFNKFLKKSNIFQNMAYGKYQRPPSYTFAILLAFKHNHSTCVYIAKVLFTDKYTKSQTQLKWKFGSTAFVCRVIVCHLTCHDWCHKARNANAHINLIPN